MHRSLAAGIAAVALGAGTMMTGTAFAGADPDDGVGMVCQKVTDAQSDATAAAALASTGFKLLGEEKPVGFSCSVASNPADANFCATATYFDGVIALGNQGPC